MKVETFLNSQTEPYYSKWFKITQAKINQFADATDDHQYIHVDPEQAKKTEFKTTIAHGFLSLSLLSAMLFEARPKLEGIKMAINYGFNKIRFTNPVPVNSQVRGKFQIIEKKKKGKNRILITSKAEVQIKGQNKTALIAEWLDLIILED